MAYYYTPLRKDYKPDKPGCPFCDSENVSKQSVLDKHGKVMENEHWVWMVNWYPRAEGHTMIVPKRHITKLEDETPEELWSRRKMELIAGEALKKLYKTDGIEIFFQIGAHSHATVKHLHWHIVPASREDFFGSFEKMGIFYTTEKDKEKIIMLPIPIKYAREDLQKALAQYL